MKIYVIAKKIYKKLKYITQRIKKNKQSNYSKSYSQCGEDMIIKFIFNAQGNRKLTWIDIGAHHPTWINNTAYFYENGFYGINIEPDPELIKEFYKKRKNDINLNIAIADKAGEADFYIMDSRTLNTLSKEEAIENEKYGHKIVKTQSIKTMTISSIIENYCNGIFPDFLSLDAEGYDLEILKTIDWEKTSPKVICVENIPYTPKLKNYFTSMQESELSKYLESKNYSIIAFSLINTIFVNNKYIEKG